MPSLDFFGGEWAVRRWLEEYVGRSVHCREREVDRRNATAALGVGRLNPGPESSMAGDSDRARRRKIGEILVIADWNCVGELIAAVVTDSVRMSYSGSPVSIVPFTRTNLNSQSGQAHLVFWPRWRCMLAVR